MKIDRDALYTLDDLAKMTGISLRTLQRLVGSHDLPARRIGRKIVCVGGDLLDHLPLAVEGEAQEAKPAPGGLRGLLGGRGS